METPNLTDELKRSMQMWIDHHCDRADKLESVIATKDTRIAELEDALKSIKASADHGLHDGNNSWFEHIHTTAQQALKGK